MVIRKGSKGTDVYALQNALLIPLTGSFGDVTHKAVLAFQHRNGLVPDGIVGSKTLMALTKNRVADTGSAIMHTVTSPFLSHVNAADIDALVSKVLLKKFRNTDRNRSYLTEGLEVMAPYRKELGLDTRIKLAYFFGQVFVETGRNFTVEENLNYSASALPKIFSYFRKNPLEARKHGRTAEHGANQRAIANRAYGKRMGNGGIQTGDGWRYRGMGAKQTTFVNNVRALDAWIRRNLPEISKRVTFMDNPEQQMTPEYALLSGAVFWKNNDLDKMAYGSVNRRSCDKITRVINRHTDSYSLRWNATKRFAELLKV